MEPNYYNNSKPTTSRFGKQISMPQISLLNRSMIVAGIGFLSIGILGFLAAYLIINVVNSGSEGTLLLLYFLFMILVLVSQFMAMFAFNRIESLSKAKIATIFVMYGIGQGIGFGFLFAALQMQFDSVSRAISYITLAFTAGGLAFLTAGYIGKKLSVQGTMTLGRYLMYLSIGFIAISFLWLIMCLVSAFTGGFGIGLDYWYWLILAFGTLLFFLYTVFDFSTISKMQNFISVQDEKVVSNYVWMFGFKLLVDLVMMVWYILLIILRSTR